MKTKHMKFLAVVIAASLTACTSMMPASEVGPTTLNDDLTGPRPDVEGIVSEHIKSSLKDPDSAKIRFGNVTRCYMRGAPIQGAKIMSYGWCAFVAVNGKNSYGAYVGFSDSRYFVSKLGTVHQFEANHLKPESWYR